jgi:hypothetical protein
VKRKSKRRVAFGVFVGKAEGKSPPGRSGINWRVLLKWIFKNRILEWN